MSETVVSTKPSLKTQRESGIELFRIITMLLIVAHHYVVNSSVLELTKVDPLNMSSLFLFLFGGWGKMGINCFVLITGYFMCTSRITTKKFVKLLSEVMFYKIIIYLIFLISGYQSFNIKLLIKAILPFYSINTNFTGCFLLFYLTIPFLNILTRNMKEGQHLALIGLLSFMYIIFGTLPFFSVAMNYVSWYIVLYFIASYVRLYPKKIFGKTWLWGIATLFLFIVSALSIVVCTWLGGKLERDLTFYFVADSNKILAVVLAFSAFMFFKNLKIRSNRFINTVASCTFGVLLIHANSYTMRQWLWQTLCKVPQMYGSQWLVLHAFGCVLSIFIVCAIIDFFRSMLIEKPLIRCFDKYFIAIDNFIQNGKKKDTVIKEK